MAKSKTITVKHFLNKRLKAGLNLSASYPIYVQIIYNRKTAQIKSRFNFNSIIALKEKYTEAEFINPSESLSEALNKEKHLITEIIELGLKGTTKDVSLRNIKLMLDLSLISIKNWMQFYFKLQSIVILSNISPKLGKIINWEKESIDHQQSIYEVTIDILRTQKNSDLEEELRNVFHSFKVINKNDIYNEHIINLKSVILSGKSTPYLAKHNIFKLEGSGILEMNNLYRGSLIELLESKKKFNSLEQYMFKNYI